MAADSLHHAVLLTELLHGDRRGQSKEAETNVRPKLHKAANRVWKNGAFKNAPQSNYK